MNKVDIHKGKLGIFRQTAMDPNKYRVIRRPWKVSITWYASFVDHAYQPKQKLEKKTQINVQALENKIEGNDQESIQLPNTFHSKTPKGKKGAPKVTASQSKHYKQKAKDSLFPKMAKRLSKIKKKNHQNIHAKIYNDRYNKRQQA